MNSEPLKKGNLIFLKSTLMDLFYIIGEGERDKKVKARKIDAPPSQWEYLDVEKVVKLAEEQEKILPSDVASAIEEQRKVVFAPPKGGGRKKRSLDRMMKGLPKEGIEEILAVLAAIGEEKENGGEKE